MRSDTDGQGHQKAPISEILKGIPGFFGIHVGEKAAYHVLQKFGPIEIREYEPMTLAQATVAGPYNIFRRQAFLKLADYIFGQNFSKERLSVTPAGTPAKKSTKISMTTPVFQEMTPQGWTMSFVLPSKYSLSNVPKPLDPDVRIVSKPGKKVAALIYHGNNTSEKMRQKQKELELWIAQNGHFRPITSAFFAQYDAPITIPLFKKNEVQVEVHILQ